MISAPVSASGDPAPEDQALHTRAGRLRARLDAVQAWAQRMRERALATRTRYPAADASFAIVDRDIEVGGGIMAGALAYRLFIWLLPLALVCVAGLGIAAAATDQSPESTASSVGLAG